MKGSRGLGKGLNALLGEMSGAEQFRTPVGYVNKEVAVPGSRQNTSEVLRVPADKIDPNPYQPRMTFDQTALDELTESIKTLGLIQPVTLRAVPGGRYQIITGERRYKACCQAGMTYIPAFVRDATDVGMHEMALVENIQREDLDPIETALSYNRLIEECSLTQDEMASRVGKNRATVANTLRLLKLPVKVQHDLKVGLLSQGHAKALLSIENPETQEQLCDLVVSEGLSVRELEKMVRGILAGVKPVKKIKTEAPASVDEECSRIQSILGKLISKQVDIRRNANGGGSMTVRFANGDELKGFLELIDRPE